MLIIRKFDTGIPFMLQLWWSCICLFKQTMQDSLITMRYHGRQQPLLQNAVNTQIMFNVKIKQAH